MPPHYRHSLLIVLVGALSFLPFLGGVHLFDWDEINFAEAAREMLETGVYLRVQIDYAPFWEKPPLFFWLQAAAMHLFGVGEMAARLPNALAGIATLLLLYHAGRRLHGARMGLLWAGSYYGAVLPFLYAKSGIIDPVFNLFIFAGVLLFVQGVWRRGWPSGAPPRAGVWRLLGWAGLCIGLAILTKGPVAYLVVALTGAAYWVWHRFRWYASPGQLGWFTLAAVAVPALWFGTETLLNGPWFVQTFMAYQYRLFSTPDAGHGGFPGYHFVVLLVGCFPASIFALRTLLGRLPAPAQPRQADFLRWMLCLFWVVLLLFSVVKSKIVHYSSLCYFPLTYFAAVAMDHIAAGRLPFARWMWALLFAVGGLFVVATVALPILGQHPEVLRPLIQDPFGRANLDAAVRWTGWEVVPGLWLLGVMGVFAWRWRRRRGHGAYTILYGGTAVFTFMALVAFIGRIEGYSQHAAVAFYKSKVEEDCYITTYGFKSYAHLFYARKRPVTDTRAHDAQWLLHGQPDKPVYVVARLPSASALDTLPQLVRVGSENGFVFYRREDSGER